METNIITLRLSNEAIKAYNFLKLRKMKPAKLLKEGGEKLVIYEARRIGLKECINKITIPF